MENAADALKIAFAIFVFVVGLTMLFMSISNAKSTADVVLYYGDDTNFQEPVYSGNTNRTVGVSDVVATLYRYYKESVAVKVKLKDGDEFNFDLGNESILIKNESGQDLLRLGTTDEIEKNLGKFIADEIIPLDGKKFTEEFVEVPISGIYVTGSDGSEITLSSGGRKVYITYTEQ